jgi:hypothetical protein
MAQWDESTRFWAETWRTMALAAVGALAALWFVKPWEKSIEYSAELDKTRLALQARVVDDFLAASHRYTALAYDACRAYTRPRRDKDAQAAIAVFEGEAVDGMRSARHRLGMYFGDDPGLRADLQRSDVLASELFELCAANKAAQQAWDAKRQELKRANDAAAAAALKALGLSR